jgi:hypothetical protein
MSADQIEERVIEVLEDLVPGELHEKACQVCAGNGWGFGHNSHLEAPPFWKMDLAGDPVFDAIWQQVRPRCEALAGAPLRVVRQYANGHTYGLGGRPHQDDLRPGCFTLLYYPMREWKEEWEGETVFHDSQGEIAETVRPRPNRAVFFDSRIPHAGRAPGRACHALRVTVAYKLETAPDAKLPLPAETAVADSEGIRTEESERDGTRRVYKVHVPAGHLDKLKNRRLEELGRTLRLPGFRPGKIPTNILEKRYGSKARSEAANRLAAEAADRIFTTGGLASAIETLTGAESGDFEFRVVVTHLPDLPALDLSELAIERLTASPHDIEAAGLTSDAANEFFTDHLRQQVLDYLDAAYSFPIAPALLEREFTAIRQMAESQLEPRSEDARVRESIAAELRIIAERRVRLGAVVAELARRWEIALTERETALRRQGSETTAHARARLAEEKVVDRLITGARVSDRVISSSELRELAEA